MIIPRLKSGGTLARVVNEIIDYLPRLRVQSTPQVLVDHTPRGQILRFKQGNTVPGSPAIQSHPFQVKPLGGDSQLVDIYWGTVGGVEAFPEATKQIGISVNSRIVVSWTLEIDDKTAGGVTAVTVDDEPVSEPFEITNVDGGTGIKYKALIATVNLVGGSLNVQQHVINHIPAII
jgi:hypothetical protein